MNHNRYLLFYISLTLTLLSGAIFVSCSEKPGKGMIIFTQSDSVPVNKNFVSGEGWRYIPGSRIALYDPAKPSKAPVILTKDFYSARSPQVAFDGKSMIFAGQKKENDPWQIWEMNLKNLEVRQVFSSDKNCIDPAYLPIGRAVFSMYDPNDTLKAGHSLYACNLDGTGLTRITYSPLAYFGSDIMMDGRILTISRQVFPDVSDPMIMVMRPDGTKADLFYGIGGNRIFLNRPWETGDGKIVFIEASKDNPEKGEVVSITYKKPLDSRTDLTSGIDGEFYSVFPQMSGKLLVTYRKSPSDRYGLYEFDPVKKEVGKTVLSGSGYNILEAVVIQEHERPRKLPSEVDNKVKTGLLLCQNINLLGPAMMKKEKSDKKAVKIEVLGINSSLGTVDVEKDGSFYLKPLADTPFRIQTLDENNKVINGPCNWMYLRPNERRGCIGCHEDYNLVPENRIPFSVKKSPVIIPVHIKKITEKIVELE